jgi:hypothetical protein
MSADVIYLGLYNLVVCIKELREILNSMCNVILALKNTLMNYLA